MVVKLASSRFDGARSPCRSPSSEVLRVPCKRVGSIWLLPNLWRQGYCIDWAASSSFASHSQNQVCAVRLVGESVSNPNWTSNHPSVLTALCTEFTSSVCVYSSGVQTGKSQRYKFLCMLRRPRLAMGTSTSLRRHACQNLLVSACVRRFVALLVRYS